MAYLTNQSIILTGYAFLSGRSGGQTLIGGSAVTDILSFIGTGGNGTLTSPAIQFKVGNNGATTAVTILNNGNIGIGTTGPTGKLTIDSTSAIVDSLETDGANLVLRSTDAQAIDLGPQLRFSGHNGSGGAYETYAFGTIAGRKENGSGNNFAGYLQFSTFNSVSSTVAEKMRITSTGNVGIGVSPTAVLMLKAGTASADTAPLKFTSGTINTTAVAAQYEYNGNHRITNVALLRMPLGGVLFDHFADESAGGAESDIYTDTLLANTFNANGDKIVATYGGNFITVGTELTQLKVKFDATGATTLWDSTALAPATGTTSWKINIELIRVSSTVIRYTVSLNTSGATGYVYCTSGELTGLTLSGTNVLKITGTSSGVDSADGDIIGKMGFISFLPAN